MSARFAETYFIDIDHSYALSERADIINYVPTKGASYTELTLINVEMMNVCYMLKLRINFVS